MKHIIIVFVILAAFANAGDERLAELIKALDNDQFEVREKAQRELIGYAKASADIWAVGTMILKAQATASKEVETRLNQVLTAISIVSQYADDWGGGPTDKSSSHIGKMPLFIDANTSVKMMGYFRRVAQNRIRQQLPPIDFSKDMLLGIATTRFNLPEDHRLVQITKHAFRRNFRNRSLDCELTLAFGQSDETNGPTTPGTSGVSYRISATDAPITVVAIGPERDSEPKVIWRYEKSDADWKNVDAVIKDKNIYAYRKLAKKLDSNVPVAIRRSFLKEVYMADPLLPYVMFTNMARNHADLFKEDYQYWKANLPEDHILRKLFDAALEEGLKMTAAKQDAVK